MKQMFEKGENMIDQNTLKILTDSAKYDVSCSSSGSERKRDFGIGNCHMAGICHSFTQDGRCISLLKILMSNKCVYDCLYCVNRRSNDVPRASANPKDLCELIMDFYKRNYIEGVFLSSAVDKSPNETMERLLDTVIMLRKVYGFNGYIHLKGIPSADRLMVMRAASFVDRMSFNIELPSEKSLKLLAPQKSKNAIIRPMRELSSEYLIAKEEKHKHFLPAGQTTQMIVGASDESDGKVLKLTESLYSFYKLKRVYFSSYVPTNYDTNLLPKTSVGLLKEHRLYQADWLLRFYGFSASELISEDEDLDPMLDPKCAWALKHPELFPVEVNTAPPEVLVRVPGIGIKGANKIIMARRYTKLTLEDLVKMRIVTKRAIHFITANGKFFGKEHLPTVRLLLSLNDKALEPKQMSMFSDQETTLSLITGEL